METMDIPLEVNAMTIQEALNEIAVIRANIFQMGNNDYERGQIEVIEGQLKAGKITPIDAVEKVHAMYETKLQI